MSHAKEMLWIMNRNISENMIAIEARGLTKSYEAKVVVRDVSLRVAQGKIFALLGANGAGKSTVVGMLTDVIGATRGEVTIAGKSLTESAVEVKRQIGVLPESLGLFEALTIEEHLMMCGGVYGLSRSETKIRAEELLKFLDLWNGRNTFVERASYGMRKKCALAMALIHNPRVLFLDEPFEGVDPVAGRNIKELLISLSTKGITIFMTSHSLEIIEKIVDELAIIVDGKIVYATSTDKLKATGESLEDAYFRFVKREPVEELAWLG